MILPAETTARESNTSGYAQLAPIYLAKGWQSVLPLPRGKKWPPPEKYTGKSAVLPTSQQVEQWCSTHSDGNPALYLVDGLLCVDIDNYAKKARPAGRALEVVAEVESQAGTRFPATWLLRNRNDGSEKRLYRVPTGLSWRSNLGAGVDLVHHGHRYVNVGINPDTSKPEQWFGPDGALAAEPPSPEQLSELPPALVVELMRDANGLAVQGLASEIDAHRLLDAIPAAGVMTETVRARLSRALVDLGGLDGARHDQTLSHVRRLVEYGAVGLPGASVALEVLRQQFVEAVWQDRAGRVTAEGEFERMALNGGQLAAAKSEAALRNLGLAYRAVDVGGCWHPATLWPAQEAAVDSAFKIFKVLGAAEWAKPVREVEYLIRGVLCQDTFGVNAGPKKSLKTHDNQAIGLSAATGLNLYGSERFPVARPCGVLYIVGEGGEVPVRRTLHRSARAYGLDIAQIASDPQFPFTTAFGAAPIDSDDFRNELKRMLDVYQPGLVLIESFYNFHPANVEAGNLYQRGRIIDEYHKFVRAECEGATSILTDHFRSTATSRSLDLDNISMAGQAENADSWILRDHRKPANVPAGFFQLRVNFNSRQWGGTEWDIDWNLGKFDHDTGQHVGDISWDVRPAVAGATGDEKHNQAVEQMLQVVRDNEFALTVTQVVTSVGGNKEKGFKTLNDLKVNGLLIVEKRERMEVGKLRQRELVGLGPRGRRSPVPALGTDEETGSR